MTELSKQDQQFNDNFKKLVALLGGEDLFKTSSLPNTDVTLIVNELINERKQEVIIEFKMKAKALLNKKIEFDKDLKKLEEEFKNKTNQKKDEFVKEMKDLFAIVDSISDIEKSYFESIDSVKG